MRQPASFQRIAAVGGLFLGLLGSAHTGVAAGNATEGEYAQAGFDLLASYEYVAPGETAAGAPPAEKSSENQIPPRVRALNDRKVRVTGFMLPVKMAEGLVTEFLLVKDPMMCCYGVMPKLNEWVVVKMTTKGVPPLMDVPIVFEGKLKVGELYDNGYLTGLYLLEAERQVDGKKE
jgi:hypothetical protein